MSKKKKRIVVVVVIIAFVLAVIFLGFSYFLGGQIVASSTQLVTNEETKNVHEQLWADYGFNYETFSQTYTIEKLNLTSSLDGR